MQDSYRLIIVMNIIPSHAQKGNNVQGDKRTINHDKHQASTQIKF